MFDFRRFSSVNLAFLVVILYPFLIQLRKVVALDIYFLSITPFFLCLVFYLMAYAFKKPSFIDFLNLFVLFFVVFLGYFYWNSPGSSIYYFGQYYILEILLYASLINRLSFDGFVRAVKWQSIFSLAFVFLEILMAGGIDLNAIASRKIGIGGGTITGFFDEPALLSYAYMLNVFVIICGVEKGIIKKKIGFWLAVFLVFVSMLTLTRATILYLIVIFFVFFYFYIFALFDSDKKRTWLYSKKKEFFVLSFLGGIVFLVFKGYIDNRFGDRDELSLMSYIMSDAIGINLPTLTSNFIYRLDQTQAAFNILIDNPFGIGPLSSIETQSNYLVFENFANYNSGNLILDFFVIFGIPLSLIFFFAIFKDVRAPGFKTSSDMVVSLGVGFVFFNIILATNFFVAVTSTAVSFISFSPNFYLGFPGFVGPRNIDGLVLVTFLFFVKKYRSL